MNQLEFRTSTPLLETTFRPRLGFLGVGWIGQNRLQAIASSGLGQVSWIYDPVAEAAEHVAQAVPGACVANSFDDLLKAGPDGIIIATPSALHAEQALAALAHGIPVFVQKPLGRNADETCQVVDAARTANRLLGVDLSYRFTAGMQRIRELILRGDLGRIYAVDLAFHNAYGPDKPWFYDRRLSGGGCMIDLGTHLVDLALWALDYPLVVDVSSRLYAQGQPVEKKDEVIEDYAVARLDLADGSIVQLACSWKLHAGRDALIHAEFHGTRGGAAWRNIGGSFYDFRAERYNGTGLSTLTTPPDAWSGRAATDWVRRLAAGEGFDPEIERVCDLAATLDAIYD